MAPHHASATPSDLITLIPEGGLVIAVTDDGTDPRYAMVRDAATAIAAARSGKVLLFCIPPDATAETSSRPRFFFPAIGTAHDAGGRPHTGSRHRDLLAAEAAAIRSHGVGVAAWLPGRAGSTGMAEAVTLTHAALLLLPAETERKGVLRRTLDYHASKIAAPVVAVDEGGRLSIVQPLGGRRPDPVTSPVAGSAFGRRAMTLASGWTR